jgi:hypothetical protein
MFRPEDVKQFAKSTLANDASPADKAAAKKAIRRINNQAEITKARPKRPKRKDYESDEAHNQALFEFRTRLDRLAIEREAAKVLDDSTASVARRKNAREALYGPTPEQPAEPVKSSQVDKTPRSRLGAAELAEEHARVQEFLDFIGKHGVQPHVDVTAPTAQEHVPPKPKPKPERWCHVHAVSLDVCRCDANEACPLCWHPKANCYWPCPNAHVRT